MTRSDGLFSFFVLACAVTWALDATLAAHWWTHRAPPEWSMLLAGLGAWGPAMAAAVVAWRAGTLRGTFGPWRTNPLWPLLALLLPWLLRLPAVLLEAVLGNPPERWMLLPTRPEQWVAMVMFSFGEELGWRGFAHPRVVARWGPTVGPAILGVVWAVWHLLMMVTPEGRYDVLQLALLLGIFPPSSILVGRLMDRAGGSLWVAVALHAGGHLDNAGTAPAAELRMRALYVAALWIAALAPAGRPRSLAELGTVRHPEPETFEP